MEQYGTAILLVSGITVFVLGEVEVSPTFSAIGIVLILVNSTTSFVLFFFFLSLFISFRYFFCHFYVRGLSQMLVLIPLA
jgi:hypothetical protein